MYLRTDLGPLDVLGELPGVCSYEELLQRSVAKDLGDGLICRVVDIATLLAAKRVANRDKDQLAIRELEFILTKQQADGPPP